MLKRLVYSVHRVLGAITSLLFLMWFVTGLILVYHSFPDATAQDKNRALEAITDSLPSMDVLLDRIPNVTEVRDIQLAQRDGSAYFTITSKKDTYSVSADSTKSLPPITLNTIDNMAKRMVNAPIAKIDTLEERDVWIMYAKYSRELPIYKVHLDDQDQHQLYISSQSGEVQQYTSRSERIWAWVGSIPHKFYFPILRKHMEVWIDTLTVISLVALLVVLTGIVVGVRAYMRSKRGKLTSPYRRVSYKWHHVVGMVFCIFLVTWTISGAVSLKKIPQWIVKTHVDYKVPSKIKGKSLALDAYKLDYRQLQQAYPELKKIEWSHFQNVPIYKIAVGEENLSIDASTSEIKELYLSEASIHQAIKGIHGDSAEYTLSMITDYEEYYLQWKRDVLLPAYKVEVNDADHSLYYINPETGNYKYVNDNRRARKWMFNAFHYFHIKWLMDRPVLWTIVIWTLSLGGIVVSATGVWLSIRFVRRKIKKKFYKKKNITC